MRNGLEENLGEAGVGDGNWNLSLLGLWGLHCVPVLGAEVSCVRCTDRARLLMNGHALGQSLFGSTYIHTHYITLHP